MDEFRVNLKRRVFGRSTSKYLKTLFSG